MDANIARRINRPEAICIGKEILHYSEVTSTNIICKEMILNGNASDDEVVLADFQTKGSGRFGRKWESPKNEGLYFSVILKPNGKIKNIEFLTLAFALSIAKTIFAVTGLNPLLKWPNDVYIKTKKLAGILAEKKDEYLIVGIGINVNASASSFSKEIKNTATSIKIETGKDIDTLNFLFKLLEDLDKIYFQLLSGQNKDLLNEYKKYSLTLGKEIRISMNGDQLLGFAQDIDDSGALIVQSQNGKIIKITSGDITWQQGD